jgi:hypothetical protein
VAFLLYFVGRRQWKNGLLFLTPLVALGSLVLAFNLHFFVSLMGVHSVQYLGIEGGLHSVFLARLRDGLAGTMVSPSRGVLVYMPWVAFAFWGAARLWKEKSPGWSRPLIVALVAIHLVQVGGIDWWGGWCFGPRYFTDLLPFFAWFLVPVWASIRARPVLRVAFAATVAFALWVQVVGAFYYPAGDWDGRPVNVSFKPQRCWDWSDNQLWRSWRAGPNKPYLLNEWKRVLQPPSGVPQP